MATDGFGDFVAERYAALARSAYLMTGSRERAEDLVQSALLVTYRSWNRLATVAAAESYTRTVMLRLLARWSRRRWRNEIPMTTGESPVVATHSVDVAAALDVRAVLRELPFQQRAVLVLRFFDDLSERDTAAILGCSVGTVKSRTHRALSTLRAVLTEEPDDDRG